MLQTVVFQVFHIFIFPVFLFTVWWDSTSVSAHTTPRDNAIWLLLSTSRNLYGKATHTTGQNPDPWPLTAEEHTDGWSCPRTLIWKDFCSLSRNGWALQEGVETVIISWSAGWLTSPCWSEIQQSVWYFTSVVHVFLKTIFNCTFCSRWGTNTKLL